MWEKARARRPSIHARAKNPRIDDMDFKAFMVQFDRFVEREKPESPLDAHELNRCYSMMKRSYFNTCRVRDRGNPDPFRAGHSWPVLHLMTDALVVRDALLVAGVHEGDARSILEDELLGLGRYGSLPWNCVAHPERWDDLVTVMGHKASDLIEGGYGSTQMGMWRYVNSIPWDKGSGLGISMDFRLPRRILHALVKKARERYHAGLLRYPEFRYRPVAVLGGTIKDSIIEHPNVLQPGSMLEDSPDFKTSKRLTGDHIILLGTHPWEASLVRKAQELRARGIQAQEPLGTLIVDDVEFSAFRFVVGKTLERNKDADAWRAYGAIIRRCHERGIRMDDAAGRNAILGPDGITLIDLEHTTFKKRVKPLPESGRRQALKRIRRELEERPGRMNAFMDGYGRG